MHMSKFSTGLGHAPTNLCFCSNLLTGMPYPHMPSYPTTPSYSYLESLLQKHFPAPSKILQIHALLLTSGFFSLSTTTTTPFAYNCLIQAHLRLPASPPCAPLRLFSAMLARRILPNHHTFPSLLKSTTTSSAAATVHGQCLRRGLASDRFVACSLLNSCALIGHVCNARQVFDEMPHPDLASCNAMLDALCLAGDLASARQFFECMLARDVVSWTTFISGLSRNGCHRDAIEMFRRLGLENERVLGEATLVSVLSACAQLAGMEGLAAGMKIHGYVVRHEVALTAFLGTALIDMYGKHGRLNFCRNAFAMVREKKVCTWNALMSALAGNGKEAEALDLFDTMRAVGFLPNQISFVAVLTACARAGLVEIGLRWFEVMVGEYKVTPVMVHCGCVVDLLGRAGWFQEAIDFIGRMPLMADASVWGALLGACKLHGNVELGAEVGRRLIALEPQQSGRYMTLRNIYLEDGKWYNATRMREDMEKAGVKKIVGQSCIAFGDVAFS